MSEPGYTEWFHHTSKPVRPGFYEVSHDWRLGMYLHTRAKLRLSGGRRYFDGTNWKAGWLWEKISIFGTHPTHVWRGLTKAEHDRRASLLNQSKGTP